MAPVVELDHAAVVDLRPAVAVPVRHLGERRQRVGGGHARRRAPAAARRRPATRVAQRGEELQLQRDPPLVGAEDLRLELGELGGDEALGVGEGLLAPVVGRDGGEVRARDLDVVAEDAVVADLERGDAGALALARLDGGDPARARREAMSTSSSSSARRPA